LFLAAIALLPTSLPAAEPAAAPTAAPSADQAEFDRLMGQIEALNEQLDKTLAEYRAAKPDEREALMARLRKLSEGGLPIQSRLFEVAEKLYAAAPNMNEKVTEVMKQVMLLRMRSDDFEDALRLAQLLIAGGFKQPGIYDLAGSAAFNACQFDLAAKYLKAAAEDESIGQSGRRYLAQVADYQAYWKKELAIRAAEAQADDLPRVLLKTSKGDIQIELFENQAPEAVANFISLIEKGFYDGLTFHRVLPGFMAQGGCPDGTGGGGPGYNIPCECYREDFRRHFRGTLSMAHAGRDTGGSQFFLTFGPTSHLDGRHTAFGRVTVGMDVLAKLQRRDPDQPGGPQPDKILEAKVLRKRDHPYEPKKIIDEPDEEPPEDPGDEADE